MTQGVSRQPFTRRPRFEPWSVQVGFMVETWHWDRFSFEFFRLPLSVSFHRGYPYTCIICRINNRNVGDRSSETYSDAINKNNIRG
jgi:hypothetical protein